MRLCTLVAAIGIVFTSCVPAADAGVRFGDGSSDPAESIQPERRPTPGTQPERTPTRRQPAPTRRSPSQPTPAVNPGDAPSSLGANLQIESMLPARSVAAFGGRMILRGEGFHKDDVHVLFAGVPLDVVERKEGRGGRQGHVIVQLPSSEDGPASGPLRLAKGPRGGPFTVENTRTVHATFQLVNESELVPEFEFLAVDAARGLDPVEVPDAWPADDQGRPYEGVLCNLRVRIHNLPGGTLRRLRTDLNGRWAPGAEGSTAPPYDHQDSNRARSYEYNTLDYRFRDVMVPTDAFTLTIETGSDDGSIAEFEIDASIETAPRTRYTIRDTFELQRFLKMQLLFAWGVVDGEVQVFDGTKIANLPAGPLPDVPVPLANISSEGVGVINLDGDLAIRLLSGPTPKGNHAWWVGRTRLLRNGWSVVRMDWEERLVPDDPSEGNKAKLSRTGGDQLQAGARHSFAGKQTRILAGWERLPKTFNEQSFQGTADPFLGDGGPMALTDPRTLSPHLSGLSREDRRMIRNRPLFVLPAQGVYLTSASTLEIGEHEVTAVLTSVTLVGPPGGKWEDAFHPAEIDPQFDDMRLVRMDIPRGRRADRRLPTVLYSQEEADEE